MVYLNGRVGYPKNESVHINLYRPMVDPVQPCCVYFSTPYVCAPPELINALKVLIVNESEFTLREWNLFCRVVLQIKMPCSTRGAARAKQGEVTIAYIVGV